MVICNLSRRIFAVVIQKEVALRIDRFTYTIDPQKTYFIGTSTLGLSCTFGFECTAADSITQTALIIQSLIVMLDLQDLSKATPNKSAIDNQIDAVTDVINVAT